MGANLWSNLAMSLNAKIVERAALGKLEPGTYSDGQIREVIQTSRSRKWLPGSAPLKSHGDEGATSFEKGSRK